MSQTQASSRKRPDVRELPCYSVTESSRYLQIPLATLRSWVRGRHYPTKGGRRFFKPIIQLPDRSRPLLSFFNLVEAHVLDAIRREYSVPLPKVRSALGYLTRQFPSAHPLIDHRFETDGLDLFVEKFGKLITVSLEGQLAMKELLREHLSRIERDSSHLPIRLYPFVQKDVDAPRHVVIDPRVSFGRPVLVGTGIAVDLIAERYRAGESIAELADDYGREETEIEEAIRARVQAA